MAIGAEAAGFLRAICENPDEDTVRLVYADWLDEHGGEGHAYLIRHGRNETVCPAGYSAEVSFYPGPAPATYYTVKLFESRAGVQYVVRRGFVDEVRCSLSNLFTSDGVLTLWALNLVRSQPVTRFVLAGFDPLADRVSRSRRGRGCWLKEWPLGSRASFEVPPYLWADDLETWRPEAEARDALARHVAAVIRRHAFGG